MSDFGHAKTCVTPDKLCRVQVVTPSSQPIPRDFPLFQTISPDFALDCSSHSSIKRSQPKFTQSYVKPKNTSEKEEEM